MGSEMCIRDRQAGMPESFNVLVKEIRSLGINIDLEESFEHAPNAYD